MEEEIHILNGPDTGRSFTLKEGANFIGRSQGNDVQINDETVSRRHLRILKSLNTYLLSDLGSQNGTFFNGNYLPPGIEVEITKGVPIVIGMTIMAVGDESCRSMLPAFESIGLTREIGGSSGFFSVHKGKTNQRKLELMYKITGQLQHGSSKKDTLEKLLDVFLEVLVRINRAVFILIDHETGAITTSISSSKMNMNKTLSCYSEEVVAKVLNDKKPLIITDVQDEEIEQDLANTLKMENIASVMCLPLVSFSELVGALYFDSLKRPYPFAPEDICFFEDIAQRTASFILLEEFTSG
jgi:hypothetical protein